MARKNILVVDDEKSQREILEMILAEEGYDVTTAASGEAALKFAKERRFDLALTDLKMTGMDGIELTHPDRVVYPDTGTTKQDVADYYDTVMEWLLPEISGRPLSIIRWAFCAARASWLLTRSRAPS